MIFSGEECKTILSALDRRELYFTEQKYAIGGRQQVLTEINGRNAEAQLIVQRIRQCWGKLNLTLELPILLTEESLRKVLTAELHDAVAAQRRLIPSGAYKA